MVYKKIIIGNKSGLHARPASLFVELANKFKSEIFIKKENTTVNAKSIMGVMTLGVRKDTEIIIEAIGSDEEEALDALVKIVEKKFNEE
ncbi:HPr family phosphocarrier protein [Alkalibaculum sp. M08DMB]|uniref:Phosphocarrier protein HPr n=1 Tax=Alkalibaculum sporogenes TaxID=2655001 RepID=A0A6A7K5X3_9FIRM|nr:HPr family phosphocarrier protein [Alkalibaculum sporogenes]MPW24820.1 HPr family phosphocarrier protein [Alkalibaculum sporogenes]